MFLLISITTTTSINWRRTLDVGITGFTYSGPISHTWYAILEYLVTSNDKLVALLIKMILDAFIFSPVAVTGYFTWRTLLEGGRTKNDVLSKLQSKFIGTLMASWKFWPGVNILNFAFVPVEYRVLYNCNYYIESNTVGL